LRNIKAADPRRQNNARMDTQPPIDWKALQTRLTQRRLVLRQELHDDRLRSDEQLNDRPAVMDQKDHADMLNQTTMDNAELSRDLVELAEVEAALQRLAAGTLGTCQGCGAPIPVARINAQPWASRCMACQVQQEALTKQKS
jgi:DnaK suppressor protein